jgi:hypothetical protein
MTHDYIRHGTTTLFAALNVLDGTVIGQCMARHRHPEFIRFLNRIEVAVTTGRRSIVRSASEPRGSLAGAALAAAARRDY